MDPEVHSDLSRKAEEYEPLPDLVTNAYYLLGKDWVETHKKWQPAGFKTPPVMITVANRNETAARVHYALTHGKVRIEELTDAERILHIDSKVLDEAEARDEELEIALGNGGENGEEAEEEQPKKKLSKKALGELLRRQVDTVGQSARTGQTVP